MKKNAFTLAEVLITLGIIGIVAAMTIPTLIQKNFEKQAVVKLRETQSIIAQTIRMAEEEYGEVSGWGLTGANQASAEIIANNLKPFLKLATDCGVKDTKYACVSKNNYKRLNGENHGDYAISRSDCYKVALLNGSSIWWRAGFSDEPRLITFWIDVNGKYQPNMYGKDLFVFVYENNTNSIKPLGADKKDDYWKTSCNKNSTGFGCAYYVLQNQNMNYLH
ncbi:MAG: type II secretion system GspH family protein [Candidatus Gastranaerophilales bacterium]|nr:type II secretion system GspH family protein [Candidatus Gastranaerophilales bacterium]